MMRKADSESSASPSLGPFPTQQTFALSPQDNRLAVLEQNDIAIYEVPAGTTKALPMT
jgi:hypothetical protein